MKRKKILNVITIILLVAIAISSIVALFMLPNKVFFSVLLAISVLGLIVYYLFSDNKQTSREGRKKYSEIFIAKELERFFLDKKPYLNPNYTISDLEKQLGVSRSAISTYITKRFRRSFNQFLNLYRILELRELQKLPENRDISVNKLCVKVGFSNAQQYHQAEKERLAIGMKNKKIKSKLNTPKYEDDKVNDLDVKKKPEIKMRV
jgi:AraC-like DNA-binding protein